MASVKSFKADVSSVSPSSDLPRKINIIGVDVNLGYSVVTWTEDGDISSIGLDLTQR